MRAIAIILSLTMLTGCARIGLSDVASTAGAAGAAGATALVLSTPAAIVPAAIAGGLALGAVVPEEANSVSAETLGAVQNPWQALLVAFDQLLANAFELVIAICIGLFGIPMLFTYLIGRMKQRPEDRRAISELVCKIGKMKE